MSPPTEDFSLKRYSDAQVSSTHIYQLVRDIRQLLNLTQEQFAAKIGVTVVTVNRWENDRTRPLPLALRQLKSLLIGLTASKLESQRAGAAILLHQYFSKDEPG
jgi:putative transcriptional regulator